MQLSLAAQLVAAILDRVVRPAPCPRTSTCAVRRRRVCHGPGRVFGRHVPRRLAAFMVPGRFFIVPETKAPYRTKPVTLISKSVWR
eukprot:1338760-Amorphochlora_amoeboformis.AAC.2